MYKALFIVGLAFVLAGCSEGGKTTETTKTIVVESDGDTKVYPPGTFDRDDDHSQPRGPETGDLDCPDFTTQKKAQAFFESKGGPVQDWHNLDADGNGVACESLP